MATNAHNQPCVVLLKHSQDVRSTESKHVPRGYCTTPAARLRLSLARLLQRDLQVVILDGRATHGSRDIRCSDQKTATRTPQRSIHRTSQQSCAMVLDHESSSIKPALVNSPPTTRARRDPLHIRDRQRRCSKSIMSHTKALPLVVHPLDHPNQLSTKSQSNLILGERWEKTSFTLSHSL